MASSSSTFSTAIEHGRFPNLAPSILHSLNTEILSFDLISYSGVHEQSLQGNYSGLPAEQTHCADQLGGGVQHNNDIYSIDKQQNIGSVMTLDKSDDGGELLRCLASESLDAIITPNITLEYPQMAESAPISSSLNSEIWLQEHMIRQSASVPSNLHQANPVVSPPVTANAHSPRRARVRMRWTMEMHDRFIDAVNLLGGSESAKPKAILDIMNVEGLTRDQVKSHLQKYKLAQVKHHPSEVAGTSVETTTSNEAIPSDVQKHIQEFALQVQIEFQKRLHDMVERTRHDLLEIHRSILENHVMSLHELEGQNLNTAMGRLLQGPAAAAPPAALLVGGSSAAAPYDDEDGQRNMTQASEAG